MVFCHLLPIDEAVFDSGLKSYDKIIEDTGCKVIYSILR